MEEIKTKRVSSPHRFLDTHAAILTLIRVFCAVITVSLPKEVRAGVGHKRHVYM